MKNGIANLQLHAELEVRDKYGKLITRRRFKSKSLLKNFAMALRGLMYGIINEKCDTLKDTGGINRTYPDGTMSYPIFKTQAPVNIDAYGIQVGVGTQAVIRDDYMLATKCSHGSGVDQFMYGAVALESVDGTPPVSQWRIIRTFSNNSGATITVNEMGLVFNAFQVTGSLNIYVMIARDKLVTGVDVANGQTLTVRYIFSVTA